MSSQQPVDQVYPSPVTNLLPDTLTNQPSSGGHSNGSFGSVFIVLAVIVVLSAIACFLGRFCARRGGGLPHKAKKNQKVNHPTSWPKEREPRQGHRPYHGKEADIEFGFEKGIGIGFPSGKKMGNGEAAKGARPPPGNGDAAGEWEQKAGQYRTG